MTIRIRRAALPADPAEAFIFDTLVRSYCDAANGGRDQGEPRELAHALFRELPEHIARAVLKDWLHQQLGSGARLWLAYDDGDGEPGVEPLFVGWVCASPGQLHYVYVKRRFRRAGLAGELLLHAMLNTKPEPGKVGILNRPLRTCSIMTWPWVERWLGRNGVTYQPTTRDHGQEEQAEAAASAEPAAERIAG